MKRSFDFCVATDWEYDRDFVELLEWVAFRNHRLETHVVDPANLMETVNLYRDGHLSFDFLYDRASDSSPDFMKLNVLAAQGGVPLLDSLQQLKWASDKATMHLEFIANGLIAPHTIIIPPHNVQPSLHLVDKDLEKLGSSFVIKPANTTGGGIGVVDGAATLQEVFDVRREFASDKYLLQERITPIERDGRRFWFRGFFCCGFVECSWWDHSLHVYELLTQSQVEMYRLQELFTIVRKIADIIKLNFFSTEIALDAQGKLIIIDYVNEVCDMRLKSRHADGVPDPVVNRIAETIADYVEENKKTRTCPD